MLNIKSIESQLRKKQTELSSRLSTIVSHRGLNEGPLSASLDEQALEVENAEVINAIDSLEGKELKEINVALNKIQTGKFGVCEMCQGPISDQRLMAYPYAATCIKCARD